MEAALTTYKRLIRNSSLIASRLSRSALCLLLLLAFGPAGLCQTAPSLAQAKKLYIEAFTGGKPADQLRQSLIKHLHESGRFQLLDSAADADAIVTGTGRIWTKGYVTTSLRAPAANRQPVYGGYLSIEITGKDQRILWSYLVTPGKSVWTKITNDLAGSLAKKLLQASGEPTSSQPAQKTTLRETALDGAGATFPAPLYQKWFESFEQRNPSVRLTYRAVGSKKGAELLAAHQVDFAASDVSAPDLGEPGLHAQFRRVPTVLGAVVPIYNLPDVTQDLRLTPEVLAGIYLGTIKNWNDPEIRRWNKGVNLPDSEIKVVHRSDGSGTTYTFSEFLSKISPQWRSSVGTGTSLNWPVGVALTGNEGVAAQVQTTPNSIGYVELVYAIQHELNFALVRNSSGEFIRASIESLATAAKSASAGPGPPPSITNSPARGAYPISTFTWILLPEQIGDPAKKTALYELLRWILTDGQSECSALAYAPLPSQVAQRELQALSAMQ